MNPPPPDLDDPDDAVHELRSRLRAADAAWVEPPGLALRVMRRPAPRPAWRGAFAMALAEGRSMSLDQAVAYALEDSVPVPVKPDSVRSIERRQR